MSSNLAYEIQDCIRFVTKHTPDDDGTHKKPELLHVIRVGMHLYMYKDSLSREVILAWFMHDLIEEWDEVWGLILEKYGQYIYDLVLANSKDMNISDKQKQLKDILLRCAEIWRDALIIKAADVYDNIMYVDETKYEPQPQIERGVYIWKNLMRYEDMFENHPLYIAMKELVGENGV